LLAEDLGFQGVPLPLVTNSGLTLERMSDLVDADETERNLILIKDYHGGAGRAIDKIRALKRHSDLIGGYEIRVFSANIKVRLHVWLSFLGAGSKATCYSKHALDQAQMARLYSQSYIFIASSISGGISNSALEAALNAVSPHTK